MARRYKLKAPSLTELQQGAALLAVQDAREPRTERDLRMRDALRVHTAAVALPSSWRTRDKLTSSPWPHFDDLTTWKALGRSHALSHTPIITTPQNTAPWAQAYCLGWAEIATAYMTPNEQLPPNTVALAAHTHALSEEELGLYMLNGDVTNLTDYARARLLVALAHHVGLDPLERPFMIITDKRAAVIYARAACADGLCRERGINVELVGDVTEVSIGGTTQLMARARATSITDSRCRDAVGVVPIMQQGEVTEWGQAKSGKSYPKTWEWRPPTPTEGANLYMKVTTKAQRRAVLGLVGLGGIKDESEADTIDTVGPTTEYHAVPEDEQTEPVVEDAEIVEPPQSDEAGY